MPIASSPVWIEREGWGTNIGSYTQTVNDVYLSYQSNDLGRDYNSDIDSANPETAVVICNDPTKPRGTRFLIYRGDWREQLSAIFPDVEKLKAHYKEHGGHFWSDGLANE